MFEKILSGGLEVSFSIYGKHFSTFQLTRKRSGQSICFYLAVTGKRQFDSNLIILGPMQSDPVALEVSSELMTENTCSVVMQGVSKYVLSETLLLTYSMSFVRSNWFVPVLLLFKI